MADLFGKTTLPKQIPTELHPTLALIRKAKSDKAAVRVAYDVVTRRFHGRRALTYLLGWRVLEKDVQQIWSRPGYLHCTTMNYLLRVLLIGSGRFSEKDIRERWTLVLGISPHQYVQVHADSTWISIDPWSKGYGISFGEHASGFRGTVFRKP